jgi:hypothetical protein
MKHFISTTLLILFLSACQQVSPSSPVETQEPTETAEPGSAELLGTISFREALVSEGAEVQNDSKIEQPFFSTPGEVILVDGESLQVFEYPDSARAEADASLVSPDGSSIGTSMVSWIGPPHFFQAGKLIVIYIGENQSLIQQLESILGPQFAGAESSQPPSSEIEPPPAILQINGVDQVSGVGTFCWSDPAGGPALCLDKIGIPTAPEPVAVESPFIIRYVNPLPEPPDILSLSIIPVLAEDRMSEDIDGMYWWPPGPGEQFDLPLEPPHQIELSLEPGLHVLNIFAQWQQLGDVSYGFLVEVASPQG